LGLSVVWYTLVLLFMHDNNFVPTYRTHFFFFVSGAAAQIDLRLPRLEVSIQHRDTSLLAHLWTNDQLVAETATFTTHNKHKRRTSMPSAVFEPAIPAIKRLPIHS